MSNTTHYIPLRRFRLPSIRATVSFFAWTVVFSLAYCQAPLYYSNQNQYFLHGLAEGGYGLLSEDWLAHTADPTPVFSFLVANTYRFLHPAAFYVYYALIQGIYFGSLTGLFAFLAGKQVTPRLLLSFQVILLLLHSALLRWSSYHLLGFDYPWYFQAGVAGQYILGAMFQPSVFGVLLLLSLCLFAYDRPFPAAAAACLGAIFHSTYLLGAGMLILGYQLVLLRRGKRRDALLLGIGSLLLVMPVTVYAVWMFAPASPTLFAEGQRILVHERIPHHCLPRLWCDPLGAGQIAWVMLALVVVRRTVLFPVLGLLFLLTTVLTLAQLATESDTLALLFPWRTSTFLVPLSTAAIIGQVVLGFGRWLDRSSVAWLGRFGAAGLACAGVAIMSFRLAFVSSPEEVALLNFVRDHKKPGDVYLIPVRIPNLAAVTRGGPNSDFKPVAAKKSDARLIPLDLQRFRLPTGAPIFVDFKSIPYKDRDVVEWWDRLHRNQRYYECICSGRLAEVSDELRREGITHIVTTADKTASDPALQLIYQDPTYRVHQLLPTTFMPNGGR